jgi:hypothetical protein
MTSLLQNRRDELEQQLKAELLTAEDETHSVDTREPSGSASTLAEGGSSVQLFGIRQ